MAYCVFNVTMQYSFYVFSQELILNTGSDILLTDKRIIVFFLQQGQYSSLSHNYSSISILWRRRTPVSVLSVSFMAACVIVTRFYKIDPSRQPDSALIVYCLSKLLVWFQEIIDLNSRLMVFVWLNLTM